jgi:DNA uptake protein ComE-like DNA-binding protein
MAITRGTRRNPLQWFAQGGWYFFVVVLSFGLLSPIPFAHAATRLRNPLHWLSPLGYLALVVVAFAITRPNDPSNLGAALAFGVMLLALVHLIWLRRRVWPRLDAAPQQPVAIVPTGTDPAVAAVLAARSRRADARRIVADDPLLARELKIGRPDLQRDYDDGGLVDLNSAPAAAIAHVCGLDAAVVERIVVARAAAGVPLTAVDDVFAYSDIPVDLWDRIRDRTVVVRG